MCVNLPGGDVGFNINGYHGFVIVSVENSYRNASLENLQIITKFNPKSMVFLNLPFANIVKLTCMDRIMIGNSISPKYR